MRVSSVFVVVAAAAVPFVAGCDIFGIRCDADSDCPESQPFCNLGLCSTEDGPVRAEGEGEDGSEGEGEGGPVGCDADADCGGGLCYDAPESETHYVADRQGTCVPGPDEDDDCAAASLFGGGRQTGGQAIFDVTATRSASTSCPSGQSALDFVVTSFDREADAFSGSGVVFVARDGDTSPRPESASVSGNTGEHTLQYFAGFGSSCYDDAIDVVAIAVGPSSPDSNAVCVTITSAP